MKRIRISLLITLALSIGLYAQSVTFDFVVKDRKGAALKTLTPADFEVIDNGEKKNATVRLATPPTPRLFSIVIEAGLPSEDRRLMKQLVGELFKLDKDPQNQFAVFALGNQLSLLEAFTADRTALNAALDLATSGLQNTRYVQISNEWKTKLAARTDALARAQLQIVKESVVLDDSEASRRALLTLNSLVTGLATQPGRKALVYVTAGLVVPPHLDAMFLGLQGRANRSGVSLYPVHSRGVTLTSQNSAVSSSTLDSLGGAGLSAESAGSATGPSESVSSGVENTRRLDQEGSIRSSDLLLIENATEGLRLNPQLGLRVLAESTGGLLVADSNDARRPFRQMLDDSATYYEVTYDPGIANFDGTFRKTAIKVAAKEARVRDRDGYFALPPELVAQADLLPYELPLLKAAGTTPLPREVEFRSGTLKVRAGKTEATASALVEVPFAGVQFKEDPAKGLYRARLAMLVQVKEPSGTVVRKFSRDLPLQGKLEQLPALQNSSFNFREQFTVPAGRYIVEASVIDQATGKIGVRKTSFVAAAKPSGVSLSSVSIVRSYQPNAKALAEEDPYQYQGGRITPTLQSTLKQVKGAQLSLFFTIYPDAADSAPVAAVVQYLKDGAVMGKADVPLPAGGGATKIPYVLTSPMDALPPGAYEIRVTARQGASAAQETALVTIEP